MTTHYKIVKEDVGVKEKKLIAEKTYSGGVDRIIFILSSIWQTVSKVSTIWRRNETRDEK